VTKRLGGENYVFWGGREGYQTLLNTDMKKELDHMVWFLFSFYKIMIIEHNVALTCPQDLEASPVASHENS